MQVFWIFTRVPLNYNSCVVGREGFEPPNSFRRTDLQSVAFNHSATSQYSEVFLSSNFSRIVIKIICCTTSMFVVGWDSNPRNVFQFASLGLVLSASQSPTKNLATNYKGCIILQIQFNGKGTSALFHTVFKCLSQPHFPRQPLLPIAPERLFICKTKIWTTDGFRTRVCPPIRGPS